MTSVLSRLGLLCALLGASLSAMPLQANQPQKSPSLELEDCFVDGITSKVKCGTYAVAEDRSKPLSPDNKIDLNIVLLPKFKEESTELPVIFLAGGPGQAATELAGSMNQLLESVRQQHDILLVDQRGTGGSNALECETLDVDPLSYDDSVTDLKEEMAKCVAKLSDFHLPSYNSIDHIKDLEVVRAALGYKKVNIFGGSYGTRAGFTYLQQFPESINTAVLDSNAPLQLVIGLFGKSGERAFDMLVQDCKQTPACNSAFPNLKQDYLTLIDSLKEGPVSVDMYHPLTGEPSTLVLTPTKVINEIRMPLYNLGSRVLVPYVVNRAANGDYRPLAAMIGRQADMERAPGQIYSGLIMNIICNEDLPRVSQAEVEKDADNYFQGGQFYEAMAESCDAWPNWQPEAGYNEPLKTDVPVLLFSGDYDPVTPPAYGDLAMETLTNAKHVLIKQAAHVASFSQCIEPINDFIKSGSFEELDFECAEEQRKLMFLIDQNQLK